MILLKNGIVVSDKEIKKENVLFDENSGKIVLCYCNENGIREADIQNKIKNAKIIDCTNEYIFPGFIDAHTHFDLSVALTSTIDDYPKGTKAAISGGTTTIIDYATQYKNESLKEALENWQKKASKGCFCDYSFHMSISDINNNQLKECDDMMDEGITSFKLYTTYDIMLKDEDLFKTLKKLGEIGGIAGIHCEDNYLLEKYRRELIAKGDDYLKKAVSFIDSRPTICEATALKNILNFAKESNATIVSVHTTCKDSIEEIRKAKQQGTKVFVETCPQYLTFTRDYFDNWEKYAKYQNVNLNDENAEFYFTSRYICAPPLRDNQDLDCLWECIKNKEIDTVATDHCSFTKKQKALGINDFRKIPGGVNLVEYRAEVLFEDGVKTGKITLNDMCRVLSTNAANIYGLYDRKGYIKEGFDADIVVFDPNKEKTLGIENQISCSDYCAYENKKVSGSIDKVFLRGKKVVENSKCLEKKCGIFLKRKAGR